MGSGPGGPGLGTLGLGAIHARRKQNKKKQHKTVGLAQSDLDQAQRSPASLFPGEASVPAGSCNLLPPLGAAASSLLPFPERC